MGLCFTGSLVLYSYGMSNLPHQQQVVGWPILMIVIILTSQMWGLIYKEMPENTGKSKILRITSVILLITAIILLAVTQ